MLLPHTVSLVVNQEDCDWHHSSVSESAPTQGSEGELCSLLDRVPCIKFSKDEAKRALQKIEQSFAEAVFSHVKHTLFALEESGLPQMTYAYESQ
jgi:hypothetical protein